jgi:UDP-N-acetylmuramoyl-tripeptide--D-alanyl-D-alanine ligase
MTMLWTTNDMLAAMGGRPIGTMPEGVSGLSIDSRSVGKGEAFFAIKGDNFDGHSFATAAMANGAAVIIVAEAKLPALGRLNMPMIVVDDVLKGLERLASAARKRSRAKVIAVTGSVGKTTTKEILRHMLTPSGTVHASEKSFNNHWGVPLTLARLPQDCDYGVFEIGMNHSGEITPLVAMVRPDVAIITLVAPAHLGNFKSINEIAEAKAEIFTGVVSGGHGVINRDDPHHRLLERKAKEAGVGAVETFGEHQRAGTRLVEYSPDNLSAAFTMQIGGATKKGAIATTGHHVMMNALAALTAVKLAGGDVDLALRSLATLPAQKGRGARQTLRHPDGGRMALIDESYNANPASMAAAIRLLQDTAVTTKGRRIAVLGDMLELGRHAPKLHAALSEPLLAAKIDLVLLAGPEMIALRDALKDKIVCEWRETARDLQPLVLETLKPGDAMMVKSSNGIGFGKIIEALQTAFPTADGSEAGDGTPSGDQTT